MRNEINVTSPRRSGPRRSGWTLGKSALARVLLAAISVSVLSQSASALKLDEMSLDRWKKLRETERYQLNIWSCGVSPSVIVVKLSANPATANYSGSKSHAFPLRE